MPNDKKCTLFGRPVFTGEQRQTLTLQVYEILLEEIRAGRWEIGERLPSVASLAQQSGLSRGPLQKAFEALHEKGFISQKRGSGSYLESLNPSGNTPVGTVGVIISYEERTPGNYRPDFLWTRLEYIQQEMTRLGFYTEVKYLPRDTDWSAVDKAGVVFDEKVKGIISLHVIDRREIDRLGDDRLPFVCVGSQSDVCVPVVAGDTYNAVYRVTKRAAQLGHERILLVTSEGESDYENSNRSRAYIEAMRECGLEPDLEATEKAMALTHGNVRTARDFLEEHSDATCILYFSDRHATELIHAAELMGLEIGVDLSIAGSVDEIVHTSKGSYQGTRVVHDTARIIEAVLQLFDEQARTREYATSRVLIRPRIIPGETLAPVPAQSRRAASRK